MNLKAINSINSSYMLLALFIFLLFCPPINGQETSNSQKEVDNEQEELPLIPPKLINFVAAEYPQKAKEENIESKVVLEIDIDVKGIVENVEVIESATPEGYGFDEEAVVAAYQFKFSPATENGVPVPVKITYIYRFEFQEVTKEVQSNETPDGKIKNFSGRTIERGTRLPIAGAVVTIFVLNGDEQVGFDAVSDEKGNFEFFNIPEGDWKILVKSTGYYPYRTTETLSESNALDVVYHVEKSSYNPLDVKVVSKKPKKEVTRTTLKIAEIERIPGAVGDPILVVKNLPGVARTGFGSGEVIVRGAAPEDTQFFVDGVNVPIIFHFGGLRSIIPAGMLDSIDFYPGNFSAEFGRGLGGIIDVQLKELKPEGFDGYFDVNLYDSGIYIETPLTKDKKTNLALGLRRSYIDAILNAAVPEDAGVGLVTAPRYYDGQIHLSHQINNANKVSYFFFGGDDRLEFLFENPADLDAEFTSPSVSTSSTFYRHLVEHSYIPNEKFKMSTRASGGRNLLNFNAGDELKFELDTYWGQVRNTSTYQYTDKLTFRGGLDYLYQTADIDIVLPPAPKEGDLSNGPSLSNPIVQKESGLNYNNTALWAELEYKPIEGLSLIPGVRWDSFTRTETNKFSPRFTSFYDSKNKKWRIKGGVGWFFQEPTFDETSKVFGNPALNPEQAVHYSAGTVYKPNDYLSFDVTGFYKDLTNLIGRSNNTVTRNGATVPEIYNNEQLGRIYGAEFLFRHEFANNFFGWMSYTLSRSERLENGASQYRIFDFDQQHIFTILGTYKLKRNWEIGARWRYVSGFPTTPRLGAIYNSDTDEYEAIFGKNNSDRVPSFHQLDLRVDKKWIYKKWILNAYVDIQNLYNRANPESINYNFDFSEQNTNSGLPLLTIFGIRGDF